MLLIFEGFMENFHRNGPYNVHVNVNSVHACIVAAINMKIS